jgi:TolB-like protein
VLPFENLSGDPEQEYFADGITDDHTTDLSHIPESLVISRKTAFTYKGKPVDAKAIGRELGVRYVLEGSVERGGNGLRVNVQLIDAETGSHLWGERFDKPVADLFEMQDEIVSRLANQLRIELEVAEAHHAERATNRDSMDHYFLGLGLYHKGGAELNRRARAHFDRALELDPENVDALVRRAWTDVTFAAAWLPDDRAEWLRSAKTDLGRAIRLRPDYAAAHCGLGVVRILTNRADQGRSDCERALAIDRNYAAAHGWIGLARYVAGHNEETEAHILEALRISPRDTNAFIWMLSVGFAELGAGRDEEAAIWLNRSIGLNPRYPDPHFLLAAALARLGRLEEAHEAVRAGLEVSPRFTIARFRSWEASDNPVFLAGRKRMIEGMRLAGAPEG